MNNEQKISDTPEYKKLSLRFRWAIDNIIQANEEVEIKSKNLQSQIDTLTNFKPAQKLKEYIGRPTVWEEERDFWGNRKNDSRGYGIYKPLVKSEYLQVWLEKNRPIYEENKRICEENAKAKALVFTFLDKINLPRKKSVYKTSRSKTKDWVTSDWVLEIENAFITGCDYDWKQMENFVKEESNKIKEYWVKKEREEQQEKLKAENEQKEKDLLILLAELNIKYKLNLESYNFNVETVLNKIIEKNKYLFLAHFLSKNRGDWSDGPNFARIGLDFFIGTPEQTYSKVNDELIIEEISSFIEDWDGDGRIFRDCEFNYDYLFGLVAENSKDLFEDYNKLKSLMPIE